MSCETTPTQALAVQVGELLKARAWRVATAESCTAGLVGHLLTNIPGSSVFFVGGVVAYANAVKQQLLGVSDASLSAHGAVSRETALAMAQGVRRLLHSDVGVAITGIAGPDGGTAAKPVGTVFLAVSSPLGDAVEQHFGHADRLGNKAFFAEAALALLKRHLASQA
jgi:PncC family amidohydrolase